MTSPIRTAAIDALLVFRFGPDPDIPPSVRIQAGRLLDALTAHFLSEAEGAKKTSGHYGGNGRPHTYWHGTPCDCSWGADHGNGTGDAPDFAAPATGKRTPLDSSSAKGDEELGKLGRDAYMIAAGQVACADWSDCTPARREEWIAAASAVRAAVEEGTQSHLGRVYEQYAANIDAANARADKAESERDAALARVEEIRIAHGSALNRVAEMERASELQEQLAASEHDRLAALDRVTDARGRADRAEARVRELEADGRKAYNALSEEVWKIHDEYKLDRFVADRIERGFTNVSLRLGSLTAPTAPAAEKTDNSPPARGER